MKKEYRIGILGCGRLGSIAAAALKEGKAPKCKLTAFFDANEEALKAKSQEFGCPGYSNAKDFIDSGLDYVIEASRQEPAREYIPYFIENGISVISLSCGAFADKEMRDKIEEYSDKTGAKAYLATGCLGGFDLAAVLNVMGGLTGTIVQYLPPAAERPDGPMKNFPDSFSGTALEGFGISPAHLNTVIAGALACGELEDQRFELRPSQPGMGSFGLELKNDQTSAKIIISQNSFELIALSTIATLKRLTSAITF